ncbi:TIGR02269 family lipoprotein [Archangium sp.]|uniref:SitA6 family polymorphic toxin lipoprotein n=1 Tax=Archangium sp. TaxID=1872627 RepID=UPI002D392EC1|nr:TIGR02269 family lipoprotein [Archangium sp.]HYO51836.1 TIGR02269 family lipoprotein [Archangium sp.]
MHILNSGRGFALLGMLLTACATSAPAMREDFEAPEVVSSSWEDARADASCVVPLCDEERCAVWRCQDLEEVDTTSVVPARWTVNLRPPPGNPMRWWGRPLVAPVGTEPVFEIHWHNWNIRGQYAPRALRLPCIPSREPLEKHHIFPQEERLARWFESKQINIHAFTVRLPKSFHSWLHSGGPRGGQWNEAWRQFQEKNPGASPERIWRFAFELMSRFGVNDRPLVPYYCE